jgi:cation:H+ antiporter
LSKHDGVFVDIIWLLAGLALIVKGGDWFVAAALRVAEFLRMPRVVIGSTLVSLATTSPEMVVSIMSGLKGESGLAVGNAVGSCICNIGLILGVTATLKHVDVHPRALRTPLVAMFVCGALLLMLTLDLTLTRWQGVMLLSCGVSYFIWDFWRHYRDRKPADIAEATAIEKAVAATRWAWLQTKPGTAVQFAVGAAVVVVGSKLLVDGAVNVAGGLGIRPIIIGLTVIAIGTSLPELVTAISSSRKAVSDLAVGNVLGANIANLTLVVGAAAVLHDVKMDRLTQLFNFPAMLLVMGLLLWMLLTNRRVTRREGVALLVTYGVYITALVVLTLTVGR